MNGEAIALEEYRGTYEQLLATVPAQTEKLERWWTGLIKETVNQMKTQVAKLSDASGTIWTRAELLCKILALQAEFKNRLIKFNGAVQVPDRDLEPSDDVMCDFHVDE